MERYNYLKEQLNNKVVTKEMTNIYNNNFNVDACIKYHLDMYPTIGEFLDMLENGEFSEDYLYEEDQNIVHTIACDVLGVDFDNEEDEDFYSDYQNDISDKANAIVFKTIETIKASYNYGHA